MPQTWREWFGTLKYVNILIFILDIINKWGELFPGVELPAWMTSVQVILAALLSSVFGIGHRIEQGEAQAPAKRTVDEVVAAAEITKEAILDAAPPGRTVEVPAIAITTGKGTPA